MQKYGRAMTHIYTALHPRPCRSVYVSMHCFSSPLVLSFIPATLIVQAFKVALQLLLFSSTTNDFKSKQGVRNITQKAALPLRHPAMFYSITNSM